MTPRMPNLKTIAPIQRQGLIQDKGSRLPRERDTLGGNVWTVVTYLRMTTLRFCSVIVQRARRTSAFTATIDMYRNLAIYACSGNLRCGIFPQSVCTFSKYCDSYICLLAYSHAYLRNRKPDFIKYSCMLPVAVVRTYSSGSVVITLCSLLLVLWMA